MQICAFSLCFLMFFASLLIFKLKFASLIHSLSTKANSICQILTFTHSTSFGHLINVSTSFFLLLSFYLILSSHYPTYKLHLNIAHFSQTISFSSSFFLLLFLYFFFFFISLFLFSFFFIRF